LSLITASLCAFVAAWACGYGHFRYARETGKLVFFKNAYDEDSYAILQAFDGNWRADRLLSKVALETFQAFSLGDLEFGLLLADVILGGAAALAAMFLASRLAQGPIVRLALSMTWLLACDLVSTASYPIWEHRFAERRAELSPLAKLLIPDATTTFFAFTRALEPQTAYILLFIYLAYLLDIVQSQGTEQRRNARNFLVVSTILPLTYIFVSLAALASASLAGMLLLFHQRNAARYLLRGAAASACLIVISQLIVEFLQSDRRSSAELVFASRLPSLPASVVLAAGLLLALGAVLLARPRLRVEGRFSLAIALIATPVLIANQQLLTGTMVSVRDWERYSFGVLILIGAALLAPWRKLEQRVFPTSLAALLLCVLLGHLLWNGTRRNYEAWLSANLQESAIEGLLDRLSPSELTKVGIAVVDAPGAGALTQVRVGHRLEFLLEQTRLMNKSPRCMDASGRRSSESREASIELYEFAAAAKWGVEELRRRLERDIQQLSGPLGPYLFCFSDFWYPRTDGRKTRQEDLMASLDEVAAEYRAFLQTRVFHRPVIAFSTKGQAITRLVPAPGASYRNQDADIARGSEESSAPQQ
jgi:hypothetical protein